MVEAACGAKGLVLAQVFNGEVGEGGGGVLDEVAEDGLVVVADEVDLVDGGDFGDGRQAVVDDGMAGDVEQRLWQNDELSVNNGQERGRTGAGGRRGSTRTDLGNIEGERSEPSTTGCTSNLQ